MVGQASGYGERIADLGFSHQRHPTAQTDRAWSGGASLWNSVVDSAIVCRNHSLCLAPGHLMADTLNAEQRHRNMARVKGKDTVPEKVVRSLLQNLGYRFRLHRPDLPGKPDLVFPSRRKVIFVHGCFWHMHKCRRGRSVPVTNAEFWRKKRQGTVDRDRRTLKALAADDWKAYVVWECALKDLDALRSQLKEFLS